MTITIVQITDLHVVPEGTVLPGGVDPVPPLVTALDALAAAGDPIAAVLFTGDLVDGGDPASYRRLRGIVEPVMARLGFPPCSPRATTTTGPRCASTCSVWPLRRRRSTTSRGSAGCA